MTGNKIQKRFELFTDLAELLGFVLETGEIPEDQINLVIGNFGDVEDHHLAFLFFVHGYAIYDYVNENKLEWPKLVNNDTLLWQLIVISQVVRHYLDNSKTFPGDVCD